MVLCFCHKQHFAGNRVFWLTVSPVINLFSSFPRLLCVETKCASPPSPTQYTVSPKHPTDNTTKPQNTQLSKMVKYCAQPKDASQAATARVCAPLSPSPSHPRRCGRCIAANPVQKLYFMQHLHKLDTSSHVPPFFPSLILFLHRDRTSASTSRTRGRWHAPSGVCPSRRPRSTLRTSWTTSVVCRTSASRTRPGVPRRRRSSE